MGAGMEKLPRGEETSPADYTPTKKTSKPQ